MKKILNVTNLLGDTLYLLRPLVEMIRQFPNDVVAVVADNGLSYELVWYTFSTEFDKTEFDKPVYSSIEDAKLDFPDAIEHYVGAGQSGDICFKNSQNGGRQLHISEGYARILGSQLSTVVPLTSWQRVGEERITPEYILISPFSRSCSVHTTGKANKTLDAWKWEHIILYLRKQGLPVKILAGPNDYMHTSVPVNDYVTAKNLHELELILKSAKLIIAVDNGIGHIAASLSCNLISLWPKVSSMDFIAPKYASNITFMQIDPPLLAPAALLTPMRRVVKEYLELPDEKDEEDQIATT